MNTPETHPLFDPNITWLNIQQMEQIYSQQIGLDQTKREANYQREEREKPSHLLSDDNRLVCTCGIGSRKCLVHSK